MFDFLNEMGKAFHNVGAAREKDLSIKDINIFPRGKSSSNPSLYTNLNNICNMLA